MNNESVIEFKDALVMYRSGARVGPVSLSVSAGEFVALAGPNGSGKTTLLNLVAGRVKPAQGQVRAPHHREIAMLPQMHVFNDLAPVTVEDIVAFGCLPAALSKEDSRNRVTSAMAETGIGHLRRCLFRELSGGQKQLTQITRLIAQDARIWLLDEPLAGLDLKWRRIVIDMLDNLYGVRKPAVIYVTHQLDYLPIFCSRALLFDGGRVLRDGSPDDVLSNDSLSVFFGNQSHVRAH